MKNENGNYMLYCGDKSYEVTPEVQETLKGAMYWEHCLKLDNIELKMRMKNTRRNGLQTI